jgi:hypothetical protein
MARGERSRIIALLFESKGRHQYCRLCALSGRTACDSQSGQYKHLRDRHKSITTVEELEKALQSLKEVGNDPVDVPELPAVNDLQNEVADNFMDPNTPVDIPNNNSPAISAVSCIPVQ